MDAFITKVIQESSKDSVIVGHRKISNALNQLKKSLENKKVEEIKSSEIIFQNTETKLLSQQNHKLLKSTTIDSILYFFIEFNTSI